MSDDLVTRLGVLRVLLAEHHPEHHAAVAEAAAEIERLRAEVDEWRKLRDPVILHCNLLRGMPAKLTPDQVWHLVADDRARLGDLESEVERLRAAMQWRPIETAPRDGTRIDLWVVSGSSEGWRVTDAYFVERAVDSWVSGPKRLRMVRSGWFAPHQDFGDDGFCDMPERTFWVQGSERVMSITATHWMPLPEPPKESQS
jgi:uncharacterized small protein (DUF1192 family)